MGKRRFALVASDDEDDGPESPPPSRRSGDDEDVKKNQKNKKRVEEEEESGGGGEDEEEEEEAVEDAKPIGEVIKVTGKSRWKRSHYKSFEFDGLQYELEDPVLLSPETPEQKPYVAIIKDISQDSKGNMKVMGQWFYRPEEAEKKDGGNWQSRDTRELFYSFHRDEIPAESVMHKCVVHFIPLHKQIPYRKQHPGFIVQKVYDTEQRRLFKLTDKDYEDNKQEEIDLLVQKTLSRLGDLPDLEPEDSAADRDDQVNTKRLLRRKNISPLDVSREDEDGSKSGQSLRAETPGSCVSNSEYYAILSEAKVLTGETQRDKWLEKLLQGVQFVCTSAEGGETDGKEKSSSDCSLPGGTTSSSKLVDGSQDKNVKEGVSLHWPDSAVPAVVSLENAANESFSLDFQKYNQKMRQLTFNLKSNALLSRRFLSGELEPSQILNMSPNELKEGLTAEEIASRQPEESQHMQMTDARCKRCSERQVGLIDIIQAGTGDRYQLECTACGCTWYASRDEASSLTIDGPSASKSVGTAPLATAKFEDVEKLVSPRGTSEKAAVDVLKKTSEAYVPVLDSQRSFNKARPTDDSGAPEPE